MDLVLQFFGDSREKRPFPPATRPPSPASTPSPAEGQIRSLFLPALFPLRRSAKGIMARGGAGARGCPSRPTWPCRARRCPLAAAPSCRGPVPAPRQHSTPRLGGLWDSAGSAADPDFRAYKSASPSLILLSSPAPVSPCNHSKTPGVESKPQWTVHPCRRRRSAASE